MRKKSYSTTMKVITTAFERNNKETVIINDAFNAMTASLLDKLKLIIGSAVKLKTLTIQQTSNEVELCFSFSSANKDYENMTTAELDHYLQERLADLFADQDRLKQAVIAEDTATIEEINQQYDSKLLDTLYKNKKQIAVTIDNREYRDVGFDKKKNNTEQCLHSFKNVTNIDIKREGEKLSFKIKHNEKWLACLLNETNEKTQISYFEFENMMIDACRLKKSLDIDAYVIRDLDTGVFKSCLIVGVAFYESEIEN